MEDKEQKTNFTPEQLPHFNGDPSAAEQWLDDFEKLSLEPAEKLERAAICFTEFAHEWFSLRDEAFQTWEQCKDEFLVRFLRSGAIQADAKVRLRRLIQDKTTTFCAHLIEVLRLCHIADPKMSEFERISWFLKSVRADYRPPLVLAGFKSLEVLRDKCSLIDSMEPFHNGEPVMPCSTGSVEDGSKLVFKTKEPQNTWRADPSPDRGVGNVRRRPFCTFCGRYGHWLRTCYSAGRR